MENSKLKLKDLVTIGVFAALYFVVIFIVGMMGMTVVGFMIYPFAASVVTGIMTMFFMAKVQKKWGVFLFTILPGILMTLMGHTVVVLIHSAVVALAAELIRRSKGYNSIKGNILTHAVLSFWTIGSLWQIFLMYDAYYNMTEKMMGVEFANQLVSIPIWIMPVLYVSVFVGGIIGGFLGKKVLRKHFEKAGLV
jgi:energy-coupling factor transport system substrate-specific component